MVSGEYAILSPRGQGELCRMFLASGSPGTRGYREHHHTKLEISAVLSGVGTYKIGNRLFDMRKGDVYLFGSDEVHYITEIGGDAQLSLLNIQFEPAFIWAPDSGLFDSRYLGIFLAHGQEFENRIDGISPEAETICTQMREMYDECENALPEYALIVKAKLLYLLAVLGRKYQGVLNAPPRKRPELRHLEQLERAIAYIAENIDGPLSLEDLAREAQMSRTYFSSVFKEMNGVTVWHFITAKRVDRAMRLLSDTEKSVTEIAGDCGYPSGANFNRVFKKLTGLTPREYRGSGINCNTGIQ